MKAVKEFKRYPILNRRETEKVIEELEKIVGKNYEFYAVEQYASEGSNWYKFIFKHKDAKVFEFKFKEYSLKIIAFSEEEAKKDYLYQIHTEFEL